MHARTHTSAQVWKRSMTCHWDFQKRALLQPPKNNHLTGKVNSAATAFSPNCKLSTPRSCRSSRSMIVLARCVARARGIYPRRSTEVLRPHNPSWIEEEQKCLKHFCPKTAKVTTTSLVRKQNFGTKECMYEGHSASSIFDQVHHRCKAQRTRFSTASVHLRRHGAASVSFFRHSHLNVCPDPDDRLWTCLNGPEYFWLLPGTMKLKLTPCTKLADTK